MKMLCKPEYRLGTGEFAKLVHKEKANRNIPDMFHKVEYVLASLTLVFLGVFITRTCSLLPHCFY